MSRRRVGFPILVALLLLILLAFAPDLFWPSKKEAPSASSGVMAERAKPAVQGRADSPLAQSSPLSGIEAVEPVVAESPLPTPLPIPLSPPGGYVQYFFGPDPRMVRVEFYFDRPMDQQSVGWALTMTPPVATMRTWEENKLIVETSRPLPPGQSYSVSISTEAKDTNGIPLAYEIRYDGYVERLNAQIAPPAVNDPGEPIRIGFNYPIDGESALEALRLEPALPGQVNWDAKNKQIFIYPDPPLLANSDYTFSFVGELRDEDGEAVEPPASQSLRTGAPFFHGDYGMQPHPALPMRLTFDRAMDAESVVEALSISPTVSVTHEWLDKTLILTPISNSFAANSTYEITLEPTATSAEGDLIMSSAYRIYLGTGQLTSLADFGMGPNVQVLLADGPRAIQYQTIAPEVAADFELYALTPNQFVDRYTKSFGVMGNSEPLQPISLDESEQVAAWQEVSTSFIAGQRGTMMQRSTSLPADVAPGLYLLNMKMATTEAQLFVALTRHTVAIKKSNDALLAWLTNSDGEPTIGADTLLFDGAGAILANGTTDNEGLLTLPLGEQDAPMLLMAEIEGEEGANEVAVAGIGPQWGVRSSSWAWGWAPPRASQQRAYAVHLYSDRPIYQPGQSVYYKAIIRKDDDARLTLPDQDTPVRVRLRDGRNNIVRTLSDTPNNFGTVDGKFQLAEGAMVGPYWLELEVDGELHRYRFGVQEYRKPDFTVDLHATMPENLNPAFSNGEVITITADARYLWGEPLANARLTWQHFYMAPEFTQDWMPPTTLMGSTDSGLSTNDEGRVSFVIPASTFLASWSGYPEGGQWGVEVTLQDPGGQSVSASTPLHFAAAPEVVQVTAPAVQLIEQPFTVALTATNATGEALAERQFQISRAVEHISGTGPNPPTDFITVTTDIDGRAQVSYTVDEAGNHHIYVNEIKESNRVSNAQIPMQVTTMVSVIDPQNVPGSGSIPYYPFYVSLDRASYAPGTKRRSPSSHALQGQR